MYAILRTGLRYENEEVFMQQGRGGMVAGKHRVSGCSGPTSKYKFLSSLEANRELEEEQETKKAKGKMNQKFSSVSELMKKK
jgi:hypothetical protein